MLERLASLAARLRALNSRDYRILLAASVLLPLFWLGLRALGLTRFHALIMRRRLRAARLQPDGVHQLARRVNTAARHSPFPATCLTRSLLLAWLLRDRGIATDLRIGVRLKDGVLDAHAWLECDGSPINDRPAVARDFPPFDRPLPAAAFRHS